jgi:hypothetical protein
MIFDALFAAIGDLAVGFAFALILLFICWLIREESRAARREKEVEVEVERVEAWSFPPKWQPPRAETDFGSERKAA